LQSGVRRALRPARSGARASGSSAGGAIGRCVGTSSGAAVAAAWAADRHADASPSRSSGGPCPSCREQARRSEPRPSIPGDPGHADDPLSLRRGTHGPVGRSPERGGRGHPCATCGRMRLLPVAADPLDRDPDLEAWRRAEPSPRGAGAEDVMMQRMRRGPHGWRSRIRCNRGPSRFPSRFRGSSISPIYRPYVRLTATGFSAFSTTRSSIGM